MLRWKFIAAFCMVLLASCAHAAIGTLGGRGGSADEPAITTCDINTGIATGLDAGTCASPVAVCDGVTNNFAAFTSFNTWAKATTTQANGQLIELRVTGNCAFTSGGNAKTFTGLTKARLWGYGATFTSNSNQPSLGVAGDVTPSGICHKALDDAAGCSARFNTVSAGATSVTINTTGFSGSLTTLCGRFIPGRWVTIGGFDIQGGYNAPYGYPPNPNYFEYAQIVSTTNCASTGQITINHPLANGYLSTWPLFNSGSGGEADQGGPATIWALDSTWGGEVDIRGVTIDSTNQAFYISRSVTLRDVTMTGSNCVIPTQSDTFTVINSTGTNCNIEIDKIIGTLTYTGTTLARLSFQSSSTNVLNWTGGSLTTDMNGTPKVANITNLTTPILKIGPYAYGVGKSATCTNCVITNEMDGSGLTEDGRQVGAIPFYTVSGGVFSYPLGVNATNLTNNGSGKVRLTVGTSAGWVTGATASISGLFSSCASPSCNPPNIVGGGIISVINGTTIDLTNFNFADVVWTGSGFLYNTAEQERWAIPGTNMLPGAFNGYGAPAFQVTGVTQSGNFVNIATTLPGGYPTMPQNGATSANIRVQMPSWRCINCSGNPQMAGDFNLASSARPILSYVNRTWTNLTTLTTLKAIGKVNSIKFNVTQAYTGSTTPLRQNFSGFSYPPNTSVLAGFNWNINLRQAGLRTITPAGVTCDTGGGPVAGPCSGDSALTLNDPATFLVSSVNLARTDGSPTDQPWTLTAEFDLDQGVVP